MQSLNPKFVVAPVLAILAFASVARGDVITINAFADGTVLDTNGDGIFESVNASATTNSIRNFPGILIDRAVIAYNLSAIPNGSTINLASFTFSTSSVTSNSSINALGYAADASLTVGDATQAATFLQNYDAFALGLGTQTVNLGVNGANLAQTISNSTDIFGMRLEGVGPANTQFRSIEAAPQQIPQLVIDYTAVPEPGSLALTGLLIGVVGAVRQFRNSSNRSNAKTRLDNSQEIKI